MKKLNLNDCVKVKLTPHGADIYYHQFDATNEQISLRGGKPIEPKMPKVDKDGYTKIQLWHFIELFGEYIGMCKPNVISDMNFYISEDDLSEVKVE